MIEEALKYYNFQHPEVVFIRHNENMTYKIIDGDKKYLLRIHKADEGLDFTLYYGNTPRKIFIESEIELLIRLHGSHNIKTQYPICNRSDEYVTRLEDGSLVTVLSWLDGESLVNIDITEELVYQIGQMIGHLHNRTSSFLHMIRCEHDETFIKRISAEITKSYEMMHIDEESFLLIEKVLCHIKRVLAAEKQNFLLIHADLSKSNIIFDKCNLSPIDFSLSGYGIPEMELGEIICSLHKDEFISALIKGYESTSGRKINTLYIKCFTALSIISYIVIHHNKVFKDEKFINAMSRWRETFFLPVKMQFDDNIQL
jgi:Ser/Thr protein kinase RdoA (MazF antagonist)